MTHSPGPWRILGAELIDIAYGTFSDGIVDANGEAVLAFNTGEGEHDNTLLGEDGDAALIAAAPELLEALQRLLPHIIAPSAWEDEEDGLDNSAFRAAIDRARDAIDKATGTQRG